MATVDIENRYIVDMRWTYHKESNEWRAYYKGYTLRARDNKVSVLRLGLVRESLKDVKYLIDNAYTLQVRRVQDEIYEDD